MTDLLCDAMLCSHYATLSGGMVGGLGVKHSIVKAKCSMLCSHYAMLLGA